MDLSPSASDVAYYLCGEPMPFGVPDTFTRAKVDRATAAATLAGEGTVAVADINNINLPGYDVTTFAGVVTLRDGGGPPEDWVYVDVGEDGIAYIAFATSYDKGGFNIEHSIDGGVSQYLMEITGATAHDFTVRARDDFSETSPGIKAFSGDDGGQYLSLFGYTDIIDITRIKLWRVGGVVSEPGPPSNFWTSFVGSHEII